MKHFPLVLTFLWACSNAQDQETAVAEAEHTQKTSINCPAEPVPVSHIDIIPTATEVILNAKSKVFGRIFRDYQGCYVKLKKPCETSLGFKKPVLRVECPVSMRDPIFIQCRGTIELNPESDTCLCTESHNEILCPGAPDNITYGDIHFEGYYNPKSDRFGWIYVDGAECYVNAPLESGQERSDHNYNWKLIACPSELNLGDFDSCSRQLIRKDGDDCFCDSLEANQRFRSDPISCPSDTAMDVEREASHKSDDFGVADIGRE